MANKKYKNSNKPLLMEHSFLQHTTATIRTQALTQSIFRHTT